MLKDHTCFVQELCTIAVFQTLPSEARESEALRNNLRLKSTRMNVVSVCLMPLFCLKVSHLFHNLCLFILIQNHVLDFLILQEKSVLLEDEPAFLYIQ